MWEYLLNNSLAIGVALVGLIGWFLESKKRKVEMETIIAQNKQQEASALSTMQGTYAVFTEDVKIQINILKKRILELEKQLFDSNQDREALKRQIDGFQRQAKKDTLVIGELRRKLNNYEKELEKFRVERKGK